MSRRTLSACGFILLLAGCGESVNDSSSGDTAEEGRPPANTLTAQEARDGWTLLFDGKTTDGWRRYGGDDVPETWTVENGELVLQASSGNMDGGDIITTREFTDFELVFDFKVGPVGNSGVFYRVEEHDGKGLWQVAPEYQVLDDPAYPATDDWSPPTHRTGENYDLHAAEQRPVLPTGEWNTGRIIARGTHVEHWLNGVMTAAYELYSDDWEARVRASKFAPEEYYARAASGAVGLQDHGTPVWYRNIKIRTLVGG
jgi:hypothetical protein